jgi:hypothetical protein
MKAHLRLPLLEALGSFVSLSPTSYFKVRFWEIFVCCKVKLCHIKVLDILRSDRLFLLEAIAFYSWALLQSLCLRLTNISSWAKVL